jgi:hypothetical protein
MLCGLLWFAFQPIAVAQEGATKVPLVGSWEFTAKPNLSSSAEIVSGLATFTSDGTVIETDASEAVLHLTAGHGIWQPSPVIGNLFIRFTSLMANPDGTLHAKRIVTMTVALNSIGDQFSGGYSFEVVTPSGHVFTMGSGTVTGQLMIHPLLP